MNKPDNRLDLLAGIINSKAKGLFSPEEINDMLKLLNVKCRFNFRYTEDPIEFMQSLNLSIDGGLYREGVVLFGDITLGIGIAPIFDMSARQVVAVPVKENWGYTIDDMCEVYIYPGRKRQEWPLTFSGLNSLREVFEKNDKVSEIGFRVQHAGKYTNFGMFRSGDIFRVHEGVKEIDLIWYSEASFMEEYGKDVLFGICPVSDGGANVFILELKLEEAARNSNKQFQTFTRKVFQKGSRKNAKRSNRGTKSEQQDIHPNT
jgi:hypothetical protein